MKFVQKQAAEFLGVSLRTYQNWESGEHEPPKTCIKCIREKILNENK